MTSNPDTDAVSNPAHLMLSEVWSRGDLELVDELTTEDYVEYDVALPDPIRGRDALKATIAAFRAGSPDLTKTVDATYVDGDHVVLQYTATGTHDGDILGVPPTGAAVEVPGVFVYRVEDGRLAEGTDVWDALGLLTQIGAAPGGAAE